MSVAKKHTEDSTLGSKAAWKALHLISRSVFDESYQYRTRNAWVLVSHVVRVKQAETYQVTS